MPQLQLGGSNPSTIGTGTGGHGRQRGTPADIMVTFSPSKASPELWMKCVLGEHFKEAKLYFVKSGGADPVDWQILAMKNVFISSYQQGGTGGDATESATLAFGELEVTYKPQKSDTGAPDADVVHKYNFEKRE